MSAAAANNENGARAETDFERLKVSAAQAADYLPLEARILSWSSHQC